MTCGLNYRWQTCAIPLLAGTLNGPRMGMDQQPWVGDGGRARRPPRILRLLQGVNLPRDLPPQHRILVDRAHDGDVLIGA